MYGSGQPYLYGIQYTMVRFYMRYVVRTYKTHTLYTNVTEIPYTVLVDPTKHTALNYQAPKSHFKSHSKSPSTKITFQTTQQTAQQIRRQITHQHTPKNTHSQGNREVIRELKRMKAAITGPGPSSVLSFPAGKSPENQQCVQEPRASMCECEWVCYLCFFEGGGVCVCGRGGACVCVCVVRVCVYVRCVSVRECVSLRVCMCVIMREQACVRACKPAGAAAPSPAAHGAHKDPRLC